MLIVDADPQANHILGLGIEIEKLENSIYECLINGVEVHKAIQKTAIEG